MVVGGGGSEYRMGAKVGFFFIEGGVYETGAGPHCAVGSGGANYRVEISLSHAFRGSTIYFHIFAGIEWRNSTTGHWRRIKGGANNNTAGTD